MLNSSAEFIDMRYLLKRKEYDKIKAWLIKHKLLRPSERYLLCGMRDCALYRRFGIIERPYKYVDKALMHDKEWLHNKYVVEKAPISHICGMLRISHQTLRKQLVKFGIPLRPSQSRPRIHADIAIEWVMFHYATKEEYLRWAIRHNIEPDVNGGQEISLCRCSEILGIQPFKIIEVISKAIRDGETINIRDIHENKYIENYKSPAPCTLKPFVANHEFFITRAVNIARKVEENRKSSQSEDKEKRIID